MAIRCTITAAGVVNEYGQTLAVGTIYTPNNDDYALALISQRRATDTDDYLGERVNAPFDEVVYPVTPAGFSTDASGNVTGLVGLNRLAENDIRDIQSSYTLANSYIDGPTPWSRIYGPTDLATLSRSAEFGTGIYYVTAQSPSNGSCMFRREGAALLLVGSEASANFGNIRSFAAGLGVLSNTTLAISVYWHKLNANSSLILRLGIDSSNYVTYDFRADANMLVEGWNTLLVSTGEAIGASSVGQRSFQTAFSVNTGWTLAAGAFTFASAVGYVAFELNGFQTSGSTHGSSVWIEGFYKGGKDLPMLTIGFDIQTSGLDLAKTSMDAVGFKGYAAIPTANAVSSAPAYLLTSADAVRLTALYNAGWDIAQHSVSHSSLGSFSDDGMIVGEIEGCRAQIREMNAWAASDLFATPNGSYSNRLVAIAGKTGVKWMRHVTNAPMFISHGLCGMANPLVQGAWSLANVSDTVRLSAFIDLLVLYGVSGHIYTHGIIAGASNSIDTNVTVFQAMLANINTRVVAGQLTVVTPSQFIARGITPNIPAILQNPNRVAVQIGTSPYDVINTGYSPITLVVSGGTVSAISYSRNGTTFDATGQIAGVFVVNPGDRIRITYSVVPAVIQYST